MAQHAREGGSEEVFEGGRPRTVLAVLLEVVEVLGGVCVCVCVGVVGAVW